MTKSTGYRVATVWGLCAVAQAGWTVGIESGADFASGVGGFAFSPGAAGLVVTASPGESDRPAEEVLLTAVTLTTRRTKGPPGMNSAVPLYLKIYEAADRKTPVGESKEAYRWDPDAGGVAPGTAATYRFASVRLRRDASYFACFETKPGPGAPVGGAGLQVANPAPAPGFVIHGVGLTPLLRNKAPLLRLELKAAASPAGYNLKLKYFSPGRWEEVKAACSSLPGVVEVRGKRTGEVLLVMKPDTTLTRAAVESAVARVAPLALDSMKALDAGGCREW